MGRTSLRSAIPPHPLMRFHGFTPWRQDYEQVECWIGDRVVDLHNAANFVGFSYYSRANSRQILELMFDVEEGLGGRATQEEPSRIHLRFAGVESLHVEEVNGKFAAELRHDLDHWEYFEDARGRGLLRFEVGGLELSFTASEVALRFREPPSEASESSWS